MTRQLVVPLTLILLAGTLAALEYRAVQNTAGAIVDRTFTSEQYENEIAFDLAGAGDTAATRRIRVSAPLENAWMNITATAIDADGTVADSSSLYIDYFLKPKQGLHWTWGARVDSAVLDFPAGEHRLRLQIAAAPATAPAFPPLRIEVLPMVSGSTARLLACAVCAIAGVSLLLRSLARSDAPARHEARPARVSGYAASGGSTFPDVFPAGRLYFIDGLRGIAALGVLVCHLLIPAFLPGARLIEEVVAAPVMEVLRGGRFGVEIFFVLSGFVIAYSIRRYRVTLGFVLRFIGRRFLRLDPPYYAGIFLAIILAAFATAGSLHEVLSYFQGWKGLAVNALYLQDILAYRSPIGSVAWTLCLEVQFYLALVILTGLSQAIGGLFAARDPAGVVSRAAWWLLLGSLAVVSVVYWYPSHDQVNFFGTWHRFFLGVLTFRCLVTRASPYPLVLLLALLTVVSLAFSDARGIVAAATAGTILLAGRTGALGRWLKGRVWQFLGRISYSLYLYHVVLAIPFLTFVWPRVPQTLTMAVLFVPFGIVVASACAWLMHELIERPSMALSRRVRYAPAPKQATCPPGDPVRQATVAA